MGCSFVDEMLQYISTPGLHTVRRWNASMCLQMYFNASIGASAVMECFKVEDVLQIQYVCVFGVGCVCVCV